MKRILLAVLLVLALGFSVAPGVTSAKSAARNTYIVTFYDNQDSDAAALGLRQEYGVGLRGIYRHALKGAVIRASARQAAKIENDPRVRSIEPNRTLSIAAQEIPTGIDRIFASSNGNLSMNNDDDWRVDADVAVIDTGIDFDHDDLNLVMAIDCTWSGPKEGTCAGVRDDGNGHGTHVAGTIGALDNDFGVVGVAPGVRLWAVKVLTNYGTGTTAQVIAGIDWVADHADQIEVANMSLGGPGESNAMDLALDGAVATGVTFVLAAGNRAMNVDNYHPAGHPGSITVSALADFDGLPGWLAPYTCRVDDDDTLAYFSNYGDEVTIAAPGVCIYSTYSEDRYATMSGTSMAAPHVSGAAAILASKGGYDPAAIKADLTVAGNFDWTDDAYVLGLDTTHEPLLDVSDAGLFLPNLIPAVSPIQLAAVGRTESGYQQTDLVWTDADPSLPRPTDIYRDGAWVYQVAAGDTDYTDETGEKGSGTHYYWVCQTDTVEQTTTCSNVVVVIY